MLHRLREAWAEQGGEPPLFGPVEVDETYVGEACKHEPCQTCGAIRARAAQHGRYSGNERQGQ